MSYWYLTIMRFQLSYTMIHTAKPTINIGPIYCTSQDCWKPLQLASRHSRTHLGYNVQVSCYLFHSDIKLTIYSSGLHTSFLYHLPLQFHTTISWLHKHLSQVTADPNWADQRALHPTCQSLAHNMTAATTSESSTTLPMQPLKIWSRMQIEKLSVRLEAARIRNSMQLDVSICI